MGRDSEGEILDPTATIVGTAHPNERASLFDKFFEIAQAAHCWHVQAAYYVGETQYFGSLRRPQIKITRIALDKKETGHFFSRLLLVFFCFLMGRPPTM